MILAAFSILALLETSSALSCNLDPAERPTALPAYHVLVETCLLFPPDGTAFDGALEDDLVRLINDARAEAGLPALTVRQNLIDVARFHSLDQAWTSFFGHEGSGGRSPFDRIAEIDRTLISSSARENVSRIGGDIDPAERAAWIHSGLMNSPGHRENILAGEVGHVAVGVVQTGDQFYATQVFVGEIASLDVEPPLEVRSDSVLSPVDLGEWTFAGYGVDYGDGLVVPIEPDMALPQGAGRLVARGRKADPVDRLRYFTIAFPGPAIIVGEEPDPSND